MLLTIEILKGSLVLSESSSYILTLPLSVPPVVLLFGAPTAIIFPSALISTDHPKRPLLSLPIILDPIFVHVGSCAPPTSLLICLQTLTIPFLFTL